MRHPRKIAFLGFMVAAVSSLISTKAADVSASAAEEDDFIVMLDVHIPLKTNSFSSSSSSCVEREVMRFNSILRSESNTQQINFETMHTPHVTLYQTQFKRSDMDKIKDTLREVAAASKYMVCNIGLNSNVVNGDYAMLAVDFNANEENCLNELSDVIVSALLPYVYFPAEIPSWVLEIKDEAKRKRKLELVEKYGSPNVFDGFDPHATVGFDSLHPNEQSIIMDNIHLENNCSGLFDTLAAGFVSVGGTVLHGPIIDVKLGQRVEVKAS